MSDSYVQSIREYLLTCKFPMKSTRQVVTKLASWRYNSTDTEYVRIYLVLERMVVNGELLCTGVKNGGNVYMHCDRMRPPFVNFSANELRKAVNLDNLPQ